MSEIDLTRFKKSTPGPWEVLEFANHALQASFVMVKIGKRVLMIGLASEDRANAELIASAPDLLEEVERLRAEVASLVSNSERWTTVTEDWITLPKNQTRIRIKFSHEYSVKDGIYIANDRFGEVIIGTIEDHSSAYAVYPGDCWSYIQEDEDE